MTRAPTHMRTRAGIPPPATMPTSTGPARLLRRHGHSCVAPAASVEALVAQPTGRRRGPQEARDRVHANAIARTHRLVGAGRRVLRRLCNRELRASENANAIAGLRKPTLEAGSFRGAWLNPRGLAERVAFRVSRLLSESASASSGAMAITLRSALTSPRRQKRRPARR